MREFDNDEIENLKSMVLENSKSVEIDLADDEITAAHDLLRKNVGSYFQPGLRFHPPEAPKTCYLTLRIDHSKELGEIVEEILYCMHPSFKISFDFFAIAKSDTRPDFQLIHPSIATRFNKKIFIDNGKDADELIAEFNDGNFHENFLEKHHLVRT